MSDLYTSEEQIVRPRRQRRRRRKRSRFGSFVAVVASLAVIGGVDDAGGIYGVVFVVVLFSVVVQGTLVPTVAERLGVPMERQSSYE